MLLDAILLEPVNIFLYTWQFLITLETQESNSILNGVYRWYRRISILFVPLAFFGVYIALILANGKYHEYKKQPEWID